MSDKPELLPCPFCGGKAVAGKSYKEADTGLVECLDCSATTEDRYLQGSAIDQWNTRADKPASNLQVELTRLKASSAEKIRLLEKELSYYRK